MVCKNYPFGLTSCEVALLRIVARKIAKQTLATQALTSLSLAYIHVYLKQKSLVSSKNTAT